MPQRFRRFYSRIRPEFSFTYSEVLRVRQPCLMHSALLRRSVLAFDFDPPSPQTASFAPRARSSRQLAPGPRCSVTGSEGHERSA